jgi:hypothetical protein
MRRPSPPRGGGHEEDRHVIQPLPLQCGKRDATYHPDGGDYEGLRCRWSIAERRMRTIENRLPRGRTCVRNGSVADLQIAKGEVAAMVAGSDLYSSSPNGPRLERRHRTIRLRDRQWNPASVVSFRRRRPRPYERNAAISWHFERVPIPYALETDWPVGAAGFEPLHLEIRSAELHPASTGSRRR